MHWFSTFQYNNALYLSSTPLTPYLSNIALAPCVSNPTPALYLSNTAPALYLSNTAPALYLSYAALALYLSYAAPILNLFITALVRICSSTGMILGTILFKTNSPTSCWCHVPGSTLSINNHLPAFSKAFQILLLPALSKSCCCSIATCPISS